MRGRHQFVRRGFLRSEIGQRNNLNSPDEIERGIDNQSVLGEPDRNGEISNDRIFRIGFAGIAVETGGKIDRKDERILLATQPIDFAWRRAGSVRAKKTLRRDQANRRG